MPRIDDRKKDYDVLGLDTTANEVEVKKAFTRLALQNHPDSNSNSKSIDQERKIKYQEICKAYKRIMAQNYDNCNYADWNNDKSDEIFFSLLGELIQNSTRTSELFTLLSAQGNTKSQFQNDNEYRCKEDVMEDDDEEAEMNKLVDILKNRLQNGKSVPAGLTQEKLTRLKDDFIKQKEEFKKVEKTNHQTPTKKPKTTATVPVAKPKPKSKKQLQAEQRRRQLEMETIAKELEEKKKKEEVKEQERKKQEEERRKQLEEERRKQEEDKKRQLNVENKRKKEKEEKEREQRIQKERERQEQIRKTQEDEQRKKEEEKRRKAEEKAAKQKSLKEAKEREEKEKLEKQQNQKNPKQRQQNQYQPQQQQQQQQQNQQKYPREVPPRFLRQLQMKQQNSNRNANNSSQDNGSYYDNNTNGSQQRDYSTSGWTEILPDSTAQNSNHVTQSTEEWELDSDSNSNSKEQTKGNELNRVVGGSVITNTNDFSWGGMPASEDWDLDITNQSRSSDPVTSSSINQMDSKPTAIGSEAKENKAVKNLFNTYTTLNSTPHLSDEQSRDADLKGHNANINGNTSNTGANSGNMSWGVSLTGSSWDTPQTSLAHWDTSSNVSKTSAEERSSLQETVDSSVKVPSSIPQNSNTATSRTTNSTGSSTMKPQSNEKKKGTEQDLLKIRNNPGMSSWAGLDDFDSGPVVGSVNTKSASNVSTGTKPKHVASHSNNNTQRTVHHPSQPNGHAHKAIVDDRTHSKLDSNLKVSGWLQNSSQSQATHEVSEDWGESEKVDEEFGWTTVKTNKKVAVTGGASAPNTPSKQDGCNAWTNRALKQLLDMGFKREQAEKALRDNNGIIESAVSDLLLKSDLPDPSSSSNSKSNVLVNGSADNNNADAAGGTPQKLNRKQRRKLQQQQQMQNADPNLPQQQRLNENQTTVQENKNTTQQQSTVTIKKMSNTEMNSATSALKLNGDGLLPTPPDSHRLIHSDGSKQDSTPVVGNTRTSKDSDAPPGLIQKPNKSQNNTGTETLTQPKYDNSNTQTSQLPIGHARPSPPTSTQQLKQTPAPIQPPNSSQSSTISKDKESTVPQMSNTDLPPPVNPVLLAQRHLQELALEDHTNLYIQQYLKCMNQSSEADTTLSSQQSSQSAISTELLTTSSMALSSLIAQPPIPANSLSDGKQKSKLLQWTQPSSSGNSEPTTPPSTEDKSVPHKVDPVSAKWGVLAAPRLSPTPAEFKPGVPWRPRGGSTSDTTKDGELSMENTTENSASSAPININSNPIHTNNTVTETSTTSNIGSSFPSLTPSNNAQQQSIVQPTPIRPPISMPTEANNTEPKNDLSWMVLKGLPPVAMVEQSLRSLCQQFGTLLHLRIIANLVFVCYETAAISKNACNALNGTTLCGHNVTADPKSEAEVVKYVEASCVNPVSQSMLSGHFPNQIGGLWGNGPAPGQPLAQPPNQFMQQSYAGNAFRPPPTTVDMNGGFTHWGIQSTPQVIPQSTQLWGPAAPPPPQQQTQNMFPGYQSPWVNSKPESIPTSVFSPAMDRCLPSELLNFSKEQGQ